VPSGFPARASLLRWTLSRFDPLPGVLPHEQPDILPVPRQATIARNPHLNRLWLALKAFWQILTDPEFAARVEPLFSKAPTGPDLRILAVLQRDGRLVDFLQEDIDAYSDSQIGAAVRDIHRGCRKSLTEYLTIEPIMNAAEEAQVQVPTDFDPAAIRLLGNVNGKPPFQGVLKHHGWRVRSVHLPLLPVARDDSSVLSPAEVEIP
jgi:hypothetical protein